MDEDIDKDLDIKAIAEYSVIDIETSGLIETEDEIIEISIVRVRDKKIADTYTTLIKPRKILGNRIQKITHISNDLLQYAPSIDEVIPKVFDFIRADTLVMHNAKFTMEFLKNNFKSIGNKPIDTLEIARQLFPEIKKYTLSNICPEIGLDNFKCNSTMDYCYMTMLLFEYAKTKE